VLPILGPDTPPYCSYNTIGVFWVSDLSFRLLDLLAPTTSQQRYWLVGGLIFLSERVLREIRSRHRTYISKIIQHPSNVMEIQIKKEKIKTRAGQVRVWYQLSEKSYLTTIQVHILVVP
jgi:hypothetical protein